MTDELKPCPFCGGEATIYTFVSDGVAADYAADCRKCGAHGPIEADVHSAVASYKRRTPDPRLERLLAAGRAVLNYRDGVAPFAFHQLPQQDRDNAMFDAWQIVEAGLRAAIDAFSTKGPTDDK